MEQEALSEIRRPVLFIPVNEVNRMKENGLLEIDFRNYFLILTFMGGGYVLINHGQVNAGYAVVSGI